MNLYLLRHGIAADPSEPGIKHDSERPLTDEGEHKVRRIAKAMKELELSFDLILSSPYVRARQTAEIVAKAMHARKRMKLTEHLTPDGNPKKLIEQLNTIKPAPDQVLLVGHEPFMSQFLGLLVAGNTMLEVDLKKGGFCKIETGSLRYGRCAVLNWLLTPRHMLVMTED